jgi:hypothetical protein
MYEVMRYWDEDRPEWDVRRGKAEVDGDVAVAGPDLAGSLTDLVLMDEYHLYFRMAEVCGYLPHVSEQSFK